MVGKKFISGMLAFLVCTGYFSLDRSIYSVCAINIRENELRRKGLQEKSEKLRKTLIENKSKIAEKQKYKENLHQQIIKIGEEIDTLSNSISALNKKIVKKENEIAEKQKFINEKFEILKKTIASIYKAGDVHTLDIILGARTFSDFVDKTEMISKMNEHSQKIISEIKAQMDTISNKKIYIEEKRNLVSKQKATLAARRKEHSALMEKNQKAIDDLNAEQVKVQSSIDENNAEYKRMEKEAEEYYAEQARKMRENKAPAVNYSSGKGYVWPVPYTTRITAPYGENRGNYIHGGIDIASKGVYGKPVLASDNGIVYDCYNGCTHDYGKLKSCGCGGGYGNYVKIDHSNGKMTIYGHLSKVNVSKNQKIKRGETIGAVGTSGHSTGPHLHYETRLFNKRYNPMSEF